RFSSLRLRDALIESSNRFECLLRLLAMRDVTAVRNDQCLQPASAYFFSHCDLAVGAVAVVVAADDKRRNTNLRQFVAQVEGREGGIEPRVVPAPEGRVDIVVVAREPLAQVAGLVGVPGVADFGKSLRFDEKMRG